MRFSLPFMTTKLKASKAAQLQSLQRKHADQRDSAGKGHSFSVRAANRGQTKKTSQPSGMMWTTSPTRTAYRQAFRQMYSFFFVMMSLLLVWVAYRAFFRMPVWFDEGFAKAVVFGIPVMWFAARSRFIAQNIGLDPSKMIAGLNLGTAVGGLYGFAAILARFGVGQEMVPGAFFMTDQFLYLALMALLTAWWESLFFFGLPVQYLKSVAGWLSDWWIGMFVVVLFLLFHAPLRLTLSGGSSAFVAQMGVLTLFVLGQFMVYTRTRNLYALVLSHFFWGLVIEIYSRTAVY